MVLYCSIIFMSVFLPVQHSQIRTFTSATTGSGDIRSCASRLFVTHVSEKNLDRAIVSALSFITKPSTRYDNFCAGKESSIIRP